MFDIHIFTLYALNQTILKKEKGKIKAHNIQRIEMFEAKLLNVML